MKLDSIVETLEDRAPRLAAAVAGAVFVAGTLYSLRLGSELRYYDERDYLGLARGLSEFGSLTKDGTTLTALRPPGYPGFLAFFLELGANIEFLRIVNYACFALSLLLLYILGKRIAGPLAGLLATVFAAMYPVFFYAAGTLYPQTLSATLLLSILVIVTRPDGPPSIGMAALGGLLFGMLILSVPTFVFSLILVGLWLLVVYRGQAIGPSIAAIAVVVMVLGSWQIRNYRLFDSFVFVSTNSGVNLLLGNSENATSDSGTNADITRYYEESAGFAEDERDRFFRDSALDWMEDNPGEAAKLYGEKWMHYFSYRDQLATASESSGARDLLMLVTYGPLLLCVVLRLFLIGRFPMGRTEALLIALFFLNAFFMALFFTRIRFRIPMDHVLVVLAAAFVARVLQRGAGRASGVVAGA